MPLIDDWRDKHPRRSSKVRVVVYIFLLIMVLVFMLKAETLVRGFTSIFFPSDTTAVQGD